MAEEHPGDRHLPHGRVGYLLIVEPEALLRWSLATYLSKWYDVFPVESVEAADRILDDHAIDAVVTSDQLPIDSITALERRARERNAQARVVRTVTGLDLASTLADEIRCIEKPFQLAELAGLLSTGSDRSPEGI